MAFTMTLGSSAPPLARPPERSPSRRIAHIVGARQRTSSPGTQGPVTACEILEEKHGKGKDSALILTYGDELPIHFEVSPRAVGNSNLAVSRLEAMIEGPDGRLRCSKKDLVIAAAPASLGLVAACRFRGKTDEKLNDLQERLGTKHEDNLLALLHELDEMPTDPYLTSSQRLIAGRFLFGNFQPANYRMALRNPRSKQKKQAPGWILGLCDFQKCHAQLRDHHFAELVEAAKRGKWIPHRIRTNPEALDGIAQQAAMLAISQALAGFASDEDRTRAEQEGDLSVVRYAQLLAMNFAETISRSQDHSQRQPDRGVGGGQEDGVAAPLRGHLDDEAVKRHRNGPHGD